MHAIRENTWRINYLDMAIFDNFQERGHIHHNSKMRPLISCRTTTRLTRWYGQIDSRKVRKKIKNSPLIFYWLSQQQKMTWMRLARLTTPSCSLTHFSEPINRRAQQTRTFWMTKANSDDQPSWSRTNHISSFAFSNCHPSVFPSFQCSKGIAPRPPRGFFCVLITYSTVRGGSLSNSNGRFPTCWLSVYRMTHSQSARKNLGKQRTNLFFKKFASFALVREQRDHILGPLFSLFVRSKPRHSQSHHK